MRMQLPKLPTKLFQKNNIFFLLFVLIFFISLLLLNQFFSLSFFEIRGVEKIDGLSDLKSRNILFLNLQTEQKKLSTINPNLKQIEIVKIYPNKLLIRAKKNKEIAQLQVGEGFFYLSQDGHILIKKREKNKDMPVIYYYQKLNYNNFSTGDKIGRVDIEYALFFIERFADLGFSTLSVDITSLNMLILNSSQKKFYLTTDKSRESQYLDLKNIVQRFKMEGVSYESVDLRFDKPIVKLKP